MSEPQPSPIKLVKPDGPGIQRRLFDAFSDGYAMSPTSLRRLLEDCGVNEAIVVSVLNSAALQVGTIHPRVLCESTIIFPLPLRR